MIGQKNFFYSLPDAKDRPRIRQLVHLNGENVHSAAGAGWLRIRCGMGGGLMPGDLLALAPATQARAGSLVVLQFGQRLLVRRLEFDDKNFVLHPLNGNMQPLRWPIHEPLPLLGVISSILRNLHGSNSAQASTTFDT
jgi:SOS-response transcriptional repressor LexA